MLTYGSVCSGAGTCALAFLPLGVKASWFCEFAPAPSAVLAHHWPSVPNMGDMTMLPERILSREIEAPDILMGGTPCQAFSVAGLRNSLDDRRGNLTLTFVEIANAIDAIRLADGRPPLVIFWENVPGVLSVDDNAFGCFLGALAGAGASIHPGDAGWSYAGMVSGPRRAAAWRVLDAQYFGVAQRRRRVFVVAGAGAFRPELVLFESEGVRRDSAPSREAREGSAGTASDGPRVGSEPTTFDWQAGDGGSDNSFRGKSRSYICDKPGRSRALSANKVPAVFGGNDTGGAIDVAPALNANRGCHNPGDFEAGALCVDITNCAVQCDISGTLDAARHKSNRGQGVLCVTGDVTHALKAEGADASEDGTGRGTPIIAFSGKDYGADAGEVSPPLRAMGHDGSHANGGGQVAVATTAAVRRLTPRECERLQGWPDDHTLVPYRGKPMADGPRYKIIGNGWALPCVQWIGRRIVAAFASNSVISGQPAAYPVSIQTRS